MQQDYDNETLLRELKQRLATHTITVAEVRALLGDTAEVAEGESKQGISFSFTKLLYVIGGVIVTLGILFFVGQIWDDIGSVGRIAVTFILGLLFAWYGTHFMRTQPTTHLGDVLHAIAGLLIPGGALVVLDELTGNIDSVWQVIGIFTAVTVLYLLLLRLFAHSILVFYAIANATIAFTLLFVELFPRVDDQIYLLYTMVVGIVYIYLAQAFRDVWNRYLVSLLNIVGAGAFYIAAFMSIFEGWGDGNSLFWEFLFPLLAIGGMAGAIKGQSRSLLLITTLALISYIVYLTSEYFADSVGWPLALVVLGFIIIGIGYSSINLSKKYIQ